MIPPQPNAHRSLEYSMSEGSQNGLPLDDNIAAGHRAAVAAAAAAVSAATTSNVTSLGARPKTARRHSPHDFGDTPGTTRTASVIPPQPNAHRSQEDSTRSEGSQNGLPLDHSIAAGHRAAME